MFKSPFGLCAFMDFDITMPLALFAVTAAAMLLNKRVEGRLKTSFEKKEFRTRDAILFVAMISAAVSVIVFVPQMTIMAVFLFSYSTLLFTFSYIFSDMRERRAQLFCTWFVIVSAVAGAVGFFVLPRGDLRFFGTMAFIFLAYLAFSASLYDKGRVSVKARWYLAVLPPALFLLLYFVYNGTPLWFPYLLNAYGVIFAILVTLYLGSLFTWKNLFIFAGFLTVMDMILVLFTGVMVTAAKHVSGLGFPILISLPTVPLVITEWGLQYMSLGLGDFFFAGILATQTFKKFGKRTAVLSTLTMSLSFAIFEVFLMNYQWGVFPGTLMIICGWLPVVAWKMLSERKQKQQQSAGSLTKNKTSGLFTRTGRLNLRALLPLSLFLPRLSSSFLLLLAWFLLLVRLVLVRLLAQPSLSAQT